MLALADVGVAVRDARATAAWWSEKLGFVSHTIGGPGGHTVMVAPPGQPFLLHLCAGLEPPEPGNTGIAFITDDLEAHARQMEARGVQFTEMTRSAGGGGRAKFADPDGSVFWLIGAPRSLVRAEVGRKAPLPRPPRPAGSSRAPRERAPKPRKR
jgi:catechol 2,3-dioxygenase-like lactoylglutathione lyase family enzyme